ncbi:hypothetical protein TKK_0019388 [Trichogramma kaykai]
MQSSATEVLHNTGVLMGKNAIYNTRRSVIAQKPSPSEDMFPKEFIDGCVAAQNERHAINMLENEISS